MPAVAAGSGARLVLSELLGGTSTLWAVDAADPRRREVRSVVEHADGWGLKAKASPDGRFIAYLRLPPGARDADSQAELWTLDLASGGHRKLDGGLDLLGAPVWSSDGSLVVARRTDGRGAQRSLVLLGYAPHAAAPPQQLAAAHGVDWLGAIGWWQGVLAYATIDHTGSHLHLGDSAPTRLTAGIARDFHLDAVDGRLSFSAVAGERPLLAGSAGMTTLAVTLPAGDSSPLQTAPAAPAALDLPGLLADRVATSADGHWSVAKLRRPGEAGSYLAVTGPAGVRPLPLRGHAEFVGWLETD